MSDHKSRAKHQPMMSTMSDADARDIIEQEGFWTPATRPVSPAPIGGHKYRVTATTAPVMGIGHRRTTYYVSSIAHLEHDLNQSYDYIHKMEPCLYETFKGAFVTIHSAERIY